MQYIKLGSTDIEVSQMALGCWPFAGGKVWGHQDDDDSIATVHAALDEGVNLFDTAEGYNDDSNSEEVLGTALSGRRDKAVIATKISHANLHPNVVAEHCHASLKRLHTDYIDLYQIHWPNHDIPVQDTISELLKLRESGKIRAIAVCNFGPIDISDILSCGDIVTDQLPYNLLWRAIEFEIQPKCVDNDIGIICYSPLAQGMLAGRYNNPDEVPPGLSRSRHFSNQRPTAMHDEPGQETLTFDAIAKVKQIAESAGEHPATIALAWVLKQNGVASLLVGARNPDEVKLNIPAFNYNLPNDLENKLTKATSKLKDALGPNADMWHSDSRMR